MEVKLLRNKNLHPRKFQKGQIVNIPDSTAKRWISRGIATSAIEQPPKGLTGYIPHQKVSIVILVKDALKYFKQCLESVVKNTFNYELIIVDNNSNAKTKEYLKNKQAELGFTLITNSENKGFAYGCNQGIKASICDYVCFLNSDTVVTYGWLGKLMNGLKLPQAGAVGPSSCWVHGKQMLREYTQYRTRDAASYIESVNITKGYEEFNYPDYLVGFCILTKKEVLNKIGGFDHHSFPLALGEDVDFSVRIARAGYKKYWIKDCYIHHYGSATIFESKINWQKLAHDTRPALKANLDSDKVKIDNDVKIDKITKVKVKINVVIPVLDRSDETIQTLRALFKSNKNIRVTIIDNGLNDLNYLKEFDVNIIKNSINAGVAGSFNQGLKNSVSSYVVLMHNDIVVENKNWIDKAIKFMEANYSAGMVGQAGWKGIQSNGFYYSEKLVTSIDSHKKHGAKEFEEVAVLDGCCNVIRNIGLKLDSLLNYYFYDADFSLQYRQAGYKLYVMDGNAIHFADDRKRATINKVKCSNIPDFNTSYNYYKTKWGGYFPLKIE